jgi:CubicO group peptidase (beta-lactamase class C family)
MARYCRMLLRGGELDGTRVLDAKTVARFTEPHAVPVADKGGKELKGLRSFGWDVDTSYSAPRGDLFKKGEGYGHTGFTGTSVWVDPGTKTAVVILTNRVHPNDKGNATPLRRQVGTIVAAASGKRKTEGGDPQITQMTQIRSQEEQCLLAANLCHLCNLWITALLRGRHDPRRTRQPQQEEAQGDAGAARRPALRPVRLVAVPGRAGGR